MFPPLSILYVTSTLVPVRTAHPRLVIAALPVMLSAYQMDARTTDMQSHGWCLRMKMATLQVGRSMVGGRLRAPVAMRRLVRGFLVAGLAQAAAAQPVFPGVHWSWKDPETAGFSPDRLAAVSARLGGAGCLVHGGEMIHEWGDSAFVSDAASSTKPFYTYLAFKAVETGRLGSLDERVVTRIPALGKLNADHEFKDRKITFHHLLSQTSGYGLEEHPGAAYAYNDFGTALLSWLLFHSVYGCGRQDIDAMFRGNVLGSAIGFEHRPTYTHRHSRPRRLRISVRDAARFMLLYLRNGRWEDRQLLREDLMAAQMTFVLPPDLPRTSGRETDCLKGIGTFGGGRNLKDHLGCQGYYWWFNRITPDGTRLLPGAPAGTFMGSGYGGRYAMIAIPEHDLVIVWHDIHPGETWAPLSEIGRFRVGSVIREFLQAGAQPTSPVLGRSRD